jgi:hypothetical protein
VLVALASPSVFESKIKRRISASELSNNGIGNLAVTREDFVT